MEAARGCRIVQKDMLVSLRMAPVRAGREGGMYGEGVVNKSAERSAV